MTVWSGSTSCSIFLVGYRSLPQRELAGILAKPLLTNHRGPAGPLSDNIVGCASYSTVLPAAPSTRGCASRANPRKWSSWPPWHTNSHPERRDPRSGPLVEVLSVNGDQDSTFNTVAGQLRWLFLSLPHSRMINSVPRVMLLQLIIHPHESRPKHVVDHVEHA